MENVKPNMTDEERAELAAKLDRELDEFIDGLEKRQYAEGWPEDRWEEEMEKHPFFMTKAPEPGEKLSPLMEGLQQLKYDPNENTTDDLATNYKEDGNFNFKHKNYRLAIMSYTEGLKIKCDDKIRALLYNNRSAAHWFLQNYRSCLRDCDAALKLRPVYDKALTRAANCCYELKRYEACIKYCDSILESRASDKGASELRLKATQARRALLRDERKRMFMERLRKGEFDALIRTIGERGAKLESDDLTPKFAELYDFTVRVDDADGCLVWPVVFMYPEYKVMDFVQGVSDGDCLLDHVRQVFEEPPRWDVERKYNPENVVVYVENATIKKIYEIDVRTSLRDVLKNTNYIIRNGTPVFILLVKDTPALDEFLKKHTHA